MSDTPDPILLDFPDHFETERLLIRAPRPGDSRLVQPAIAESIDSLRPWMPWARTLQAPEETELVMRRMAAKFLLREDLMLLLLRRSDGAFVGSSGLHRIDWEARCFEIGYWARASEQGKGYVTEAVRGISAFAFGALAAERVEIRCDARNTRSAAVAERAGYALEGRLRHNSRGPDASMRDTLVFAMLRDDYLERAGQSPAG